VAWCCETRRAHRNLLAALCNTLLGKVSCAGYLAGQRRCRPGEKQRELRGRDTIICASFLLIQRPREGRYRLSYVPRWQQLTPRRARTLRSRLQRRYSIAEDEQHEVPAKATQEALTLQAWSFWFGRCRLFPADRGVATPPRGAMRLGRIEQSNRWWLQKIAASGMHRMRPDTLNPLSRANMEAH
jgi:hypothetical protein